MIQEFSKEALTPPEAGIPHVNRVHALAEREGVVNNWHEPDFEAIRAAFDRADAMGITACLAGRISFAQRRTVPDMLEDQGIVSSRGVAVRVTAYDYRSCGRTVRSEKPGRSSDHHEEMGSKYRLKDRLVDLDTLRCTVLAEIEDPERRFKKGRIGELNSGEPFIEWEYIHDEREIALIRGKEKAALEKVLNAMRIEVFETSRRTRGYPARGSIDDNDTAMVNTYTLRYHAQRDRDVLLLSMIEDLSKRESPGPLLHTYKSSWGGYTYTSKEDPDWYDYVERELGVDPFDLF